MNATLTGDEAAPGLGGYTPRFVTVDGLRTRYYDVGSGDVVLLCHGMGWAGCYGADTWVPVLDGLSRRFRVLAPDMLASGMTDNPASEADYTIQAQLAHLRGFIEALGLGRMHVVGQSRGAYPMARLALEQPGRVRSLVLVNSQSIAPEEGEYSRAAFLARRDVLFAGRPAGARAALAFTLERLSFSAAHITDDFLDLAEYLEEQPKARATRAAWESGGQERFEASLDAQKAETLRWIAAGGLKLPTLVCWGRDDRSALLAQGLALFELIAQHTARSELWIVNQAGHFPFREHPAAWVRVVGEFLAASDGA